MHRLGQECQVQADSRRPSLPPRCHLHLFHLQYKAITMLGPANKPPFHAIFHGNPLPFPVIAATVGYCGQSLTRVHEFVLFEMEGFIPPCSFAFCWLMLRSVLSFANVKCHVKLPFSNVMLRTTRTPNSPSLRCTI